MEGIILDTLLDALKLLPFLFISFLIIELIEHHFSAKSLKFITSSGVFGPIVGSILGVIPQCGFSVLSTNLYMKRIITIGTLISIYLSTSDEMLPILISNNVGIYSILKILGIKILIGILFGTIIDFIFKNKLKANYQTYKEECECGSSILKSSTIHTFKTLIFIVIISFILNCLFAYLNEDVISKIFFTNSIFSPLLSSLLGLVPNCASSIFITEFYLNNVISFGSCMAGLLTNSGIALLVLFKNNKNIKENLAILFLIYLIGSISGLVLDILGVMV